MRAVEKKGPRGALRGLLLVRRREPRLFSLFSLFFLLVYRVTDGRDPFKFGERSAVVFARRARARARNYYLRSIYARRGNPSGNRNRLRRTDGRAVAGYATAMARKTTPGNKYGNRDRGNLLVFTVRFLFYVFSPGYTHINRARN